MHILELDEPTFSHCQDRVDAKQRPGVTVGKQLGRYRGSNRFGEFVDVGHVVACRMSSQT